MKVTNTTPEAPKPFTPVHITFVFETEAELSAVGKLFNSGYVCDVLKELGANVYNAYKPFEDAGVDITSHKLIAILSEKLSQQP